MPSSPLKTEWKNVHVTLPAPQVEFLERLAEILGISKNAIYQLALRMGAPLVHAHTENMRGRLKREIEAISKHPDNTPVETREISGAALEIPPSAITQADDRRKRRKPGRR